MRIYQENDEVLYSFLVKGYHISIDYRCQEIMEVYITYYAK